MRSSSSRWLPLLLVLASMACRAPVSHDAGRRVLAPGRRTDESFVSPADRRIPGHGLAARQDDPPQLCRALAHVECGERTRSAEALAGAQSCVAGRTRSRSTVGHQPGVPSSITIHGDVFDKRNSCATKSDGTRVASLLGHGHPNTPRAQPAAQAAGKRPRIPAGKARHEPLDLACHARRNRRFRLVPPPGRHLRRAWRPQAEAS
jgi:hypothetical protein